MVPVDGDEGTEEEAEEPAPNTAVVGQASDEESEVRKRRRRGRRGGRRNRRGEGPMGHEAYPAQAADAAAADEPNGIDVPSAESVPDIEPELATAVADFGGPAVPAHEPAEAVAHPTAEAPRRRSTVREPVAFPAESSGVTSVTSPAPDAVEMPARVPDPAPEPASEAANKPRRTGWWAKRLLGGH